MEEFEIPDCLKEIFAKRSKISKDCFFYKLLDNFYSLHRQYHQATPGEKAILRKYLDELSKKITEHQEVVSCFPDLCFECPGMQRCLNCQKQKKCIDLLNLIEDNKNGGKKKTD